MAADKLTLLCGEMCSLLPEGAHKGAALRNLTNTCISAFFDTLPVSHELMGCL